MGSEDNFNLQKGQVVLAETLMDEVRGAVERWDVEKYICGSTTTKTMMKCVRFGKLVGKVKTITNKYSAWKNAFMTDTKDSLRYFLTRSISFSSSG